MLYLSLTSSIRWLKSLWVGASESRFPGWFMIDCISTARSSILSPPPSCLRMIPNHFNLIVLICFRISKLIVHDLASCRTSLPVIRLSIWLFAPLIRLITLSVRVHDSHPQVISEQTAIVYMYSLIFRLGPISGESAKYVIELTTPTCCHCNPRVYVEAFLSVHCVVILIGTWVCRRFSGQLLHIWWSVAVLDVSPIWSLWFSGAFGFL